MRRSSVFRIIVIGAVARYVTARPNNAIRPSIGEGDEEAVEGPARDSPVLLDSDALPAWKLPMEHRMGEAAIDEEEEEEEETVLPDLRGVEQRVFDELGVGDFFSLWLVFLGGRARYSTAPFTVLAPTNASTSASAESLLREGRERAAAAVRAHIIMDEKLRPEAVLAGGELRRVTSGGQTVTFRIDTNGNELNTALEEDNIQIDTDQTLINWP